MQILFCSQSKTEHNRDRQSQKQNHGVTKRKKITAYQKGHWAEILAAAYLWLKGYKILTRRYKSPVGEIDLIAQKGRTLAAVEIKARDEISTALEAVNAKTRWPHPPGWPCCWFWPDCSASVVASLWVSRL